MAPRILLVDHFAYRPPDAWRVPPLAQLLDIWAREKRLDEDELGWAQRLMTKSGLGDGETFLPPALNPGIAGGWPHRTDLRAAAEEAEVVLCGAVTGLLDKTGLTPADIDILVTTCSIFCPTPSLASLVVNRLKMRPDIQSYHLGGMGCANGVVAVTLVADLLKARPGCNALLLTTETVTPAYYGGNDRHRLVSNLLFRMGGSAVLLSSNTRRWAGRAKYLLEFRHRVHVGQNDDAYTAVRYWPDEAGRDGIYLGKHVVAEASHALTLAMRAAGPKVLSLPQQVAYAARVVARRVIGQEAVAAPRPSFSSPGRHFLLHAGGAKVLEGLGKSLGLNAADLEPSRAVLHDYGNVSSSTTWYCLGFVESLRGVAAGDRLLQVGVGSGIKCGVNVWKALREIHEVHGAWQHRCASVDGVLTQHDVISAAAAPRTLHVLLTRVLFWALLLLAAWLAYHSE